MYLIRGYIAARAQLVTFILFVLTIYFIERFLETKKKRYAVGLIIIPTLIANLHTAVFPFYFILYLPYIAEYIIAILAETIIYRKFAVAKLKFKIKIATNKNEDPEKIKQLREELKNGPVIYAFNHSNMHDVPTAGEIIKEHSYLLASDEIRGKIPGMLFELMGVVWTNRFKEPSKHTELSPFDHMLKLLNEGESIKTFPERTWNLSENSLVYPFKWGNVKMAQCSGRPIIPIVMEYDYKNNICNYSIGEPIHVKKTDDLEETNNKLRDALATMRYKIIETKGIYDRETAKKEFDEYKKQVLEEFPFDEEMEKTTIYRRYATNEEVFAHLNNIRPNLDNAYLFGKRKAHKVELEVVRENEAAILCYKKCGFIEEGIRRSKYYYQGKYLDTVVMGILKEEYKW